MCLKQEGLHEKHAVATWEFWEPSEHSLIDRHRETKQNLCRDGRSQDLPDTDL